MRKIALLVLAAMFLGTGVSNAGQGSDVHTLKRQQKVQRRQLKEQQRATRRVMSQHATTREERTRMNRDLKTQRKVLKNQQKQELSDMNQSHKTLTPHSSKPPKVKGHESGQ